MNMAARRVPMRRAVYKGGTVLMYTPGDGKPYIRVISKRYRGAKRLVFPSRAAMRKHVDIHLRPALNSLGGDE